MHSVIDGCVDGRRMGCVGWGQGMGWDLGFDGWNITARMARFRSIHPPRNLGLDLNPLAAKEVRMAYVFLRLSPENPLLLSSLLVGFSTHKILGQITPPNQTNLFHVFGLRSVMSWFPCAASFLS